MCLPDALLTSTAVRKVVDGVLYRRAREGDQKALERLINVLDAAHAEARPDLYYVAGEHPRGPDFLATVLSSFDELLIVADCDGDVAGFVHLKIKHTPAAPSVHERRYAEIDSVVVDPKKRGTGIGRELIETALACAGELGIADQQINVHAFNQDAQRLYERMGFQTSTVMLRRLP